MMKLETKLSAVIKIIIQLAGHTTLFSRTVSTLKAGSPARCALDGR
jgi:hypothetical protein